MRYFRIFLLHFQQAFENRGRSLIWLLLAIINPLLVLSYWLGVYHSKTGGIAGWSLSSVTSYYFLLMFAGSFLIAHVEYDVAVVDIQEGGLGKYLLRPFSYFWHYFLGELAWRVMQGTFSLLVLALFILLLGKFVPLVSSPHLIIGAIITAILGLFLSFIFKMIVGFSAFWLTDFHGLQSISEIIILIFGGFVMPLEFYPPFIAEIAKALPFAYMVYYPVIALQGKLPLIPLLGVIGMQLVWIGVLLALYKYLFIKGTRLFTGVGQ